MPMKIFSGHDATVVLECKACGMRVRAFKANYKTIRFTCHNCHGTRFRKVQE